MTKVEGHTVVSEEFDDPIPITMKLQISLENESIIQPPF